MDLFSIPHLLIVLLVVMVLFGTNRLPEIGAGLGKAIRNFKQASSELDEVDATFKKDEKDITKLGDQPLIFLISFCSGCLKTKRRGDLRFGFVP